MQHYARILVGADESASAERAALRAIDVAAFCGASLHVVHIVPRPTVGAPVGPAGAAAIARQVATAGALASQSLAAISRRADERGVRAQQYVRHDDIAAGIIAVANEIDAELIVVGNRGVDPSGRYVLSSVPMTVLYSAPCDVLIVRTTPT